MFCTEILTWKVELSLWIYFTRFTSVRKHHKTTFCLKCFEEDVMKKKIRRRAPLAKINITSDLHSIGTVRVRGWSKHTNYLDNYVRVLRKKFCSKFCLFVYLLTKMCAISRNFGPRKFLKKNFFFFSFLLWLLSKQIDDVLKNVDDIEWPAIDALRIG